MEKVDMSKGARAERYQEFLQLKSLPFWSKEQELRYCWLFKQRNKDNEYAFKNRIKEGNFVGVINEESQIN